MRKNATVQNLLGSQNFVILRFPDKGLDMGAAFVLIVLLEFTANLSELPFPFATERYCDTHEWKLIKLKLKA